jgi:hypothetical protein
MKDRSLHKLFYRPILITRVYLEGAYAFHKAKSPLKERSHVIIK